MALTPTEEAQTRALLAQQAQILSLASEEPAILSSLGATDVNLSQLPAASSVSDADLLLLRQGSTDKSVTGSALKSYAQPSAASETVSGIVELATNAEVQAGTDTTRAVHPAGLASLTATETRSGLIELATNAEVQAGTDTTRAVHPAGLASLTATETRSGLIELATVAEAQAMSDAVRALSPARLASAFGGANQSLADSGYQKLPGGLIIQWGKTNLYSGQVSAAVTFPVAFPSAVLCITFGDNAVNSEGIQKQGAGSVTLAGFTLWTSYEGDSPYWMAIGH